MWKMSTQSQGCRRRNPLSTRCQSPVGLSNTRGKRTGCQQLGIKGTYPLCHLFLLLLSPPLRPRQPSAGGSGAGSTRTMLTTGIGAVYHTGAGLGGGVPPSHIALGELDLPHSHITPVPHLFVCFVFSRKCNYKMNIADLEPSLEWAFPGSTAAFWLFIAYLFS